MADTLLSISFNSHDSLQLLLLVSPLYRWRNWRRRPAEVHSQQQMEPGCSARVCLHDRILLPRASLPEWCDGKVAQSCKTLCDPMDHSLPGSSVHGVLQTRILEWVAFPTPGDLPKPGIEPRSSALQADSLLSEPPGKLYKYIFVDLSSHFVYWDFSFKKYQRLLFVLEILVSSLKGFSLSKIPFIRLCFIARWSTPKLDWLYSSQPKMEKLYTVNKNKTRSWL